MILEPGTIQSHPEMGVGLVSKYRYTTEDKLSELQNDFRRQIEKYLPDMQSADVYVYLEDSICYINVSINGTLYTLSYNSEKNSLNATYRKLHDL